MLKSKSLALKSFFIIICLIFAGYATWWITNQITHNTQGSRSSELFSDTYWILPLLGGVGGLWAARVWGGFKSVFGKSILFFSAGLLAQVFGQVVYSYYALHLKIEVPYPSVGDVGFFGSIPLYIVALILLAKTTGARFSRVSSVKKLIAILLPIILLAASYIVFLRDYEFSGAHALTVFLDFGYPLGQAFYISLALITYFLSRGLLGGIMKNKILLFLGALVLQYSSDYVFLFQNSRGTWYAGGYNDFMYLISYFVMAVALLRLGSVAQSINDQTEVANG